jgi:hypothetical protein
MDEQSLRRVKLYEAVTRLGEEQDNRYEPYKVTESGDDIAVVAGDGDRRARFMRHGFRLLCTLIYPEVVSSSIATIGLKCDEAELAPRLQKRRRRESLATGGHLLVHCKSRAVGSQLIENAA